MTIGLGLSFHQHKSKPVSDPALLLLGNESAGMALDFLTGRAVVRDRVKPENNFIGDINDILTYSDPSYKSVFRSDGNIEYGNTLRCDHHPVTGEPLGINIEAAATNLFRNSIFAGAVSGSPGVGPTVSAWGDSVTGSSSLVVSPSRYAPGNRVRIECAPEGARRYFIQTVTLADNSIYSASCWAVVSVPISAGQIIGTVSSPAGMTSETLVDGVVSSTVPADGLPHLITRRLTTTTGGSCGIRMGLGTSNIAYGTWAEIDLPQIELGTFATSFIPTTASQVTRNTDIIYALTSKFCWDIEKGSFAFWAESSPTPLINFATLGSDNSSARYAYANSGSASNFYYNGVGSGSWGSLAASTLYTWVMSLSNTRYRGLRAGSFRFIRTTIENSNLTSLPIQIRLGSAHHTASPMRAHFRRLVYLPRELDDAEMQTKELAIAA